MERAEEAKMKTYLLERLNDVDEFQDLNETLKKLL
jgi:glycosyltransferase A (GT-A) superfamily protein (DUF2064 family)